MGQGDSKPGGAPPAKAPQQVQTVASEPKEFVPYTAYSVDVASLQKERGIVTVSAAAEKESQPPLVAKMNAMPRFEPLLKETQKSQWTEFFSSNEKHKRGNLEHVDPNLVISLVEDYQQFSRQCSRQVAREQRELNTAMVATEKAAAQTLQRIRARTADTKKHGPALVEAKSFLKSVEHVRKSVDDLIKLADDLASLLPPDLAVEPFESLVRRKESSAASAFSQAAVLAPSILPIGRSDAPTPAAVVVAPHVPPPKKESSKKVKRESAVVEAPAVPSKVVPSKDVAANEEPRLGTADPGDYKAAEPGPSRSDLVAAVVVTDDALEVIKKKPKKKGGKKKAAKKTRVAEIP